jgi:hypothetical protein
MRTICSGVCLFFNFESPPLDHLGPLDSHSSWISFQGAGHLSDQNHERLSEATREVKRMLSKFINKLRETTQPKKLTG